MSSLLNILILATVSSLAYGFEFNMRPPLSPEAPATPRIKNMTAKLTPEIQTKLEATGGPSTTTITTPSTTSTTTTTPSTTSTTTPSTTTTEMTSSSTEDPTRSTGKYGAIEALTFRSQREYKTGFYTNKVSAIYFIKIKAKNNESAKEEIWHIKVLDKDDNGHYKLDKVMGPKKPTEKIEKF